MITINDESLIPENINATLSEEISDFVYLYDHRRLLIDPHQIPLRIDKYLMDRVADISRNKIQNAIKTGAVMVNDKHVKANYKVRPGDELYLIVPRPDPDYKGKSLPENIPLNIIFEDDDIIVLNKPAGLVVHPGNGNPNGTLINGLLYYMQDKMLPVLQGNTADRPGLVHRIDKNTSGLMVVAKNEYSLSNLARQFYNHTTRREYYALVWGEPEVDKGTIVAKIGRDPFNHKNIRVFEDSEEGGKHAVTHFEVIEKFYYVTLIKCRLETGRTHQIRIHMGHLGHPLFNDGRYGGHHILKGTIYGKYRQFVFDCFKTIDRHALHAKTLGFVHPRTEQEIFFESELPEDFTQALEKWRNYIAMRKDGMNKKAFTEEEKLAEIESALKQSKGSVTTEADIIQHQKIDIDEDSEMEHNEDVWDE